MTKKDKYRYVIIYDSNRDNKPSPQQHKWWKLLIRSDEPDFAVLTLPSLLLIVLLFTAHDCSVSVSSLPPVLISAAADRTKQLYVCAFIVTDV